MNRLIRITLFILGLTLLILLVVPFLIPVSPLEGTVPTEELAGPESRFITLNDLQVHYQVAGEEEPVIVLLHGFLASVYSWREVMEPLAEQGRVITFDRPAFGLTERPMEWEGENPYSAQYQVAQTMRLMDALGAESAVLVGHSAGGALALLAALEYPQRVKALVLVDAAIYTGGGAPRWIRPLLATPQARRLGPLFLRSIQNWGEDFGRMAWHDSDQITAEVWEGYTLPLQVENWDRALWEFTLASRPLDLPERLAEIGVSVLVITGDDDRIVPTEESIRLAEELPDAELVVIPHCGHVPHEECPGEFLAAVEEFLSRIR